jgi:hypothetical protein
MIHFHSSDERFCGTKEKFRQFALDENSVTCQECKDADCLELSQQGKEYLASEEQP